MAQPDFMALLKIDLGIIGTAYDPQLVQLIDAARAFIAREGIALTDSAEDTQLLVMYAHTCSESARQMKGCRVCCSGRSTTAFFQEVDRMLLDSGIVTIYRQENIAEAGDMPQYGWDAGLAVLLWGKDRWRRTLLCGRGLRTTKLILLIEVQRNRQLSAATDRAELDGTYYRIVQIQHVQDDDGLPKTDLALERIEGLE